VGLGYNLLVVALVAPVLILGVYWAPVSRSIERSLSFYRSPAQVEPLATSGNRLVDTPR